MSDGTAGDSNAARDAATEVLAHDPSQSLAAQVIEWSIRHRGFVLLAAAVLGVLGWRSMERTPLDAIPDLSDTQVIIRVDFPSQAPQVVEDQITYPLSTTLLALPRTKVVRGFSMFGTGFVYVLFDDGTDLYWARSRVLEAMSQVQNQLPPGVTPTLGPDATAVDWIYQYALVDRSGKRDLADLRTLQDWFLKFELSGVPGVAEVAAVGGFVKEYHVLIDPNRLRGYGVSLEHLKRVIRDASGEVGGQLIEQAETEFIIRTKGYVSTVHDLSDSVVAIRDGTPIRLGDFARVVTGPALRHGVADLNGEGEVVGGIVVMRPGYNALNVIRDVKAKLKELEPALPAGVEVVPVYDRSSLIERAVETLKDTPIEECILVAVVSFIFLLHLRSAFVVIVALPLGILGAFLIMHQQGITANIMSLSGIAIAIGAMVDAAIVMVENAHRNLSHLTAEERGARRQEVLIAAAKEVGPGLFFSLLIITASFLPVFALTGQSAKLFAPLAFTKTYAMAVAAIISLTLVPVLMVWFIRGRLLTEHANPINRLLAFLYRPLLAGCLRARWLVILVSLGALGSAWIPFSRTGSEFMPPLDEGSLLYMPMTLPGVSITKVREILQQTNRMIRTVPEVELVFGKAGRADTATDPAPLPMIETWIRLKPREEWRTGLTTKTLIEELDRRVRLPGLMNSWGYPIKIRLDMLSTGIRTPVGIKVAGPDLDGVSQVAQQIESVIAGLPGTRSVIADRVTGGKYIEINPDRRAISRYGISMDQVQRVIAMALGGIKLTETVEGARALRRDPALRACLPRDLADDPGGSGHRAKRRPYPIGGARPYRNHRRATADQVGECATQRLGVYRYRRQRSGWLCRQGTGCGSRGGDAAARILVGLVGAVRAARGGAGALVLRGACGDAHHRAAALPAFQALGSDCAGAARIAVRAHRRNLGDPSHGLQHVRRRGGGVHRSRRRRGGNGRGHADLSRSATSRTPAGDTQRAASGSDRRRGPSPAAQADDRCDDRARAYTGISDRGYRLGCHAAHCPAHDRRHGLDRGHDAPGGPGNLQPLRGVETQAEVVFVSSSQGPSRDLDKLGVSSMPNLTR